MNAVASSVAANCGNRDDVEYVAFLRGFEQRFLAATSAPGARLFTTNADPDALWSAYITSFPESQRQHHTCNACRHFIQRYGGLVTIDEAGRTHSVMWSEAGDARVEYGHAIAKLRRIAASAKVTGVFLTSDIVIGQPITGSWRHLSVPVLPTHHNTLLTARQAMAEKREDFGQIMRAIQEYSGATLATAVQLLTTDALYRSEKVLGAAEWLQTLSGAFNAAPSSVRSNIVWRAIASAPAGFCHPRSGMIGTLLDDIAAGKSFDEVARAFKAKMHPLSYQRPQAAPSAGAIAEAEKIVAKLGNAGSLARRFARPDELQSIWKPAPVSAVAPSGGVFASVKPKASEAEFSARVLAGAPPTVMTWAKFRDTVLPTAERIEWFAPTTASINVFLTAVNQDAPPILQWDREECRNPFSTYVWMYGRPPEQFGLGSGQWHPVELITPRPHQWNAEPGSFSHQGEGVMFIIAGARETRNPGAGLFPEILRSEFHGIRSVIESYSRAAVAEGLDVGPHACGPDIRKESNGADGNTTFRVTTSGRSTVYKLDRWD